MEKSPLLADPECLELEEIVFGEKQIRLHVKTYCKYVQCPRCRDRSARIHSRYHRQLGDLPWQGVRVTLDVKTRRFFCDNSKCEQVIFCERLAKAANRYARKTKRLEAALKAIAFAMSSEAGTTLACKLAMPIGEDSLLRRLRKAELTEKSPPRVLGIDDWALKKGRDYGTVLVDLEKHEVVDLIEDRSAEALANWLEKRPGIEIVTRDRSKEYIKGINEGAPNALQIADRWHLLHNLKQFLERYLNTIYAQLKRLPVDESKQTLIEKHFQSRPVLSKATKAQTASAEATRALRLENYHKVKKLYEAGMKLLPISKKLGLHRITVRTYAYADGFPERAKPPRLPSMLDAYLPYIDKRLAEGCENASLIWREMKAQGFPGKRWQVLRYVQHKRDKPSKHQPYQFKNKPEPKQEKLRHLPLPSNNKLTWLLLKNSETHSSKEQLLFRHVLQHKELNAVHKQALAFKDIVTGQKAQAFDTWLELNETSKVKALKTFAEGLRSDYDAIYAALDSPWSNGQVEGQVTRIKYLKRMMYGRAKFDLLRARVLHAA